MSKLQASANDIGKPSSIAAAAAVRLTLRFPFWTEIFYSMDIREATPEMVEQGLKTEATDGRYLWINHDHFGKLKLDDQVCEIVHELLHKILLHPLRRGARDPHLWNVAADLAANDLLKQNGFVFDSTWLWDAKYSGWLTEHIYADLLKDQRGGKATPQLAPGRGDLKDPVEAMSPEQLEKFEEEIKALVERAVTNAKAYGKVPMGIEQGIVQAFKPKKEAWYNTLHRFMQALTTSEYNWARLNRRTLRSHGVFTPLHLSEALGEVRIFIDASGSVFNGASQANFAGHLNAILAEAKPRRVKLYYFDTKVYPGQTFEAGTLEIESKPRGGGGTAFEPLFNEANLDEDDQGEPPAVCIVLTDLEGSFPSAAPDYPVIWASIEEHDAPFGEVIYLGDRT